MNNNQSAGNIEHSYVNGVNINTTTHNGLNNKKEYIYIKKRIRRTYFISICGLSIAILSAIFSLYTVCVEYPNTENLKFDYAGVVVSAFALLVTAVLGWNIYTIIDIKEIKNDFKEHEQKINEGFRNMQYEIECDINTETRLLYDILFSRFNNNSAKHLAVCINSFYQTRTLYNKQNSFVRDRCLDFSLNMIEELVHTHSAILENEDELVSNIRQEAITYLKKEFLSFDRKEIKDKYNDVENTLNKILEKKDNLH